MLAQIVRRLREDRGWTRLELAGRAELSESAIADVENGGVPDHELIAALARGLRVDVSILYTRWDSARQTGPFAEPVRALIEFLPSPIGSDALRADRIVDKLAVELMERLDQRGIDDLSELRNLADELQRVHYPSPLAQARGHAFAECVEGVLLTYAGRLPDRSPDWAQEYARELVRAALGEGDSSFAEFRELFSTTARRFASWFVAEHSAYLGCVQVYLLERTELDFALLARPELHRQYAERYDLVSGLAAGMCGLLIGVATLGAPPPRPLVLV